MSKTAYGSIMITDSTDGVNAALINLYKQGTTTPSVPSTDLVYNFQNTTITGNTEGWSQTTSGFDPTITTWIITAMALSSESTDTILSGEWSVPVQVSDSSTPAQDGLNQATVFIYIRSNTTPQTPANASYTFANGAFTAPSGWSKTIPGVNGKPCFVTSAVAIGRGATATLAWATPAKLAEDGAKGEDGFSPVVTSTSTGVQIEDKDGHITYINNGTNGQTYYTHIRYSSKATPTAASDVSTSPTGKSYMGIQTTTSQTAPAWNNSGWTWVKYVGENGQPGAQGNPGAQGVSVTSVRELYYLTQGSSPSKPTSSTTIVSTDTINAWTTTLPSYVANGKYYVSLETTLSNSTKVWSNVSLDKATTDANYNAYLAMSASQHAEENSWGAMSIASDTRQYFWNLTTDYSTNVKAGTYITKIPNDAFKTNPSSGGANIFMQNAGIWLRNGLDNLATLQETGLYLYVPEGTYKGKKGMSLTKDALTFYNIDSTNGVAATLNANGLRVVRGGVYGGSTSDLNNFVFLSTQDFGNNVTVNNHAATDWRLLINNKFGVDKAGNLYANNAYIKGKIEADTGYIASSVTIGSGGTSLSTLQSNLSTALQSSVEYIVGTHGSTATNVWTGTTRDTALVAGKTIAFYMTSAGTSTAATLNLTLAGGGTTGAKGVRINNSNVTTHFPQYTIINLTYDGTYWKCDNYNSDTYNRTRWQNVITAATAITSGRIICGTSSGYKNIAANIAFDMAYPLLYAGSTLVAAATGDNNYLEINGVNASSNGTITSGAANKVLYLKGTLTGNTFKISASPFMTTVVPTSQDNICYIPIGIMYSATNIYFKSSDQIYAYKDGAFGPISLREASGAAKTATSYITHIDNNGIFISPYSQSPTTSATGNSVKINGDGLYVYKGGVEVAKFSDTARIGVDGKQRFHITANGITGYTYNSTDGAKAQLQLSPTWNCFGDPNATRITMGWSGDPYVYMNAGGKAAFNVAAKADGSDTIMDLYAQGTIRVRINKDGMAIRNSSGTTIATYGDSIALASNGATVTVGQVAADKYNAYITTSNFQIRNNTTAIATFGSSISLGSNGATVTIGKVAASNYNAYITTSGFSVRNNTTAIATFGSSINLASNGATVTIGKTGTSGTYNTVISSTGLKVNDNTTCVAEFAKITRIGPVDKTHITIYPDNGSVGIWKGVETAYANQLAEFDRTALTMGAYQSNRIRISDRSIVHYDQTEGVPFAVETATTTSSPTYTWYARSREYKATPKVIYTPGNVKNGVIKVGVGTETAFPTSWSSVTVGTEGTQTITISGITFTVKRSVYNRTVSIQTNTASKVFFGIQFDCNHYTTKLQLNGKFYAVGMERSTYGCLLDITGDSSSENPTYMYTYGNFVHLNFQFKNTNSVANNGIIYKGQLPCCFPVAGILNIKMNMSSPKMIGTIDHKGVIIVKNVSGGTLSGTIYGEADALYFTN